ncbi:MAG TPA: prephenate dehydrogenase [Bacteroidota bacterium]|nr:prephenate dehydrogenase [Bacteroidota bacterium]
MTIVGVGLMGGSLGLAIKRRFPATKIIGVDKASVLAEAHRRRAIDAGTSQLRKAIEEADLAILSTPLSSILRLIPRIASFTAPHTIVTDVGSVKLPVIQLAERYFPQGNFIGGHPMTGSESSGIGAAHPLLFENAVYVLTPTSNTRRDVVTSFSRFVLQLGARPAKLYAEVHDEVASVVSHLAQLTAVALTNVAGARHPVARKHLSLAAGGFRDMTRIASSDPLLWRDILRLNAGRIRGPLRLLRNELRRYEKILANSHSFKQEFERARMIRRSIPTSMKGFLHPLVDLFVFVQDRPGMLARLTAALAKSKINIKDIELVKVRERIGGTFRLSFESGEIVDKAKEILVRAGFEVSSRL